MIIHYNTIRNINDFSIESNEMDPFIYKDEPKNIIIPIFKGIVTIFSFAFNIYKFHLVIALVNFLDTLEETINYYMYIGKKK
tara:strand:- start:236 stop:481 length:246 start_codon:yes stop_codon:yes gene_type:complete